MNHSLYILSLTSLASIGCQSDKSDTSQTSGAVEYVSPDLNGDGSINILDIQLCVNVILGAEIDPGIVARADVHDDGSVNVIDVQAIVNIILAS